MGSRRLRPMTAADLPTLPEPCARCTFWESSLSTWPRPPTTRTGGRPRSDWAEAVTRHWGYCGVLAQQDDSPIGHLCMAPARYVPRLGAFATTPVSPDAAVILSARVVEEFRGKGIGRQLVQSAAGLVVRRDIRALEAVGTYHDGPSCMLPTGLAGGGRVRGRPAAPDHPAAADGPAVQPALARPRRRLAPAGRPGQLARRPRAGLVRPAARGPASADHDRAGLRPAAGARPARGRAGSPSSSSRWVPTAEMRPSSSTRIWSASATVASRCATITRVRCSATASIASRRACSLRLSRLAVGSSSSSTGARPAGPGRWPAAAARRRRAGCRPRPPGRPGRAGPGAGCRSG